MGGQLCQVLEAREHLREHREVTGLRVLLETSRHPQTGGNILKTGKKGM